MKTFNELLERLVQLKIVQTNTMGKFEDDIPEDIRGSEIFSKIEFVQEGCGISKHRWYETSVDVYEVDGRFLGVRGISMFYDKGSWYDDLYNEYQFMEMTPVTVTTYISK